MSYPFRLYFLPSNFSLSLIPIWWKIIFEHDYTKFKRNGWSYKVILLFKRFRPAKLQSGYLNINSTIPASNHFPSLRYFALRDSHTSTNNVSSSPSLYYTYSVTKNGHPRGPYSRDFYSKSNAEFAGQTSLNKKIAKKKQTNKQY